MNSVVASPLRTFIPSLLLSFALTGCATFDWHSQPRDAVLSAAFERIDQVALDPPDFARLGLVGAQGLAMIDPALDVARQKKQVFVLYAGQPIERMPAPDAKDAIGWAALITHVAKMGARLSPAFVEVPPDEVQRAAIAAAVSTLDPYSSYRGPARAVEEREQREGYGDIGIEWEMKDSRFIARSVQADSPGGRAGILPGDLIVAVDGEALSVTSLHGLARRLHGPPDSRVKLGLLRDRREVNLIVERRKYVNPTVTAHREGPLTVLRITSFNSGTAEQVESAIKRMAVTDAGESRGLIIDLRGNSGGLLDQAVAVADLFLTAGQGILWTAGRHPGSFQTYQATGGDILEGKPMALLIDGRTASSSEVLAAALRDNGRAVLIGSATLGKGSVQTVTRMPNNGELLLTWSLMYGPKGLPIHRLGLVPVVCTAIVPASAPGDEAALASAAARGDAQAIAAWRNRCPSPAEETGASVPVRKPDADLASAIRSLADPEAFRALATAGIPAVPPIPGPLQAAR